MLVIPSLLPTPSSQNVFHFPGELSLSLVAAEKVQQSRDISSKHPAENLQFFFFFPCDLWSFIHLKCTDSKIKHLCEQNQNGVSQN